MDQLLADAGRALLVHNVRHELVLEVAQRAERRAGRQLAQGAERGIRHRLGKDVDLVQVLQRALALGDAGQHLQHSLAADAAGSALPAGLGVGEGQEELGELHHTGVFVHHDHAARAHRGAGAVSES